MVTITIIIIIIIIYKYTMPVQTLWADCVAWGCNARKHLCKIDTIIMIRVTIYHIILVGCHIININIST